MHSNRAKTRISAACNVRSIASFNSPAPNPPLQAVATARRASSTMGTGCRANLCSNAPVRRRIQLDHKPACNIQRSPHPQKPHRAWRRSIADSAQHGGSKRGSTLPVHNRSCRRDARCSFSMRRRVFKDRVQTRSAPAASGSVAAKDEAAHQAWPEKPSGGPAKPPRPEAERSRERTH